MQSPGCVDNDHVGLLCLGMRNRVVGHRCRISSHFLFDHGNSDTLAPDVELLDGGCAEGVGGSQNHFLAFGLKLVGQFGDSGGFAHTIDAYDENDVRTTPFG